MAEPEVIPLGIGGMHAGGAAQLIPDGSTRLAQNVIRRPGPHVEKRPPLATADDVTTHVGLGFALWQDRSTGRVRTVFFRTPTSGTNHQLRITASSGGSAFADNATGPTGQGVVTSHANLNGVLYYAVSDDRAGTTRDPSGLHAFDGTNVTQYPLGGETIAARCLSAYIGRLFLGFVKATVTNQLGTSLAYDPSGFTATNVTCDLMANGSTITARITPTNTTNAKLQKDDVYTVAASTSEQAVVFSWSMRGVFASVGMPVTLEVYYSHKWAAATAYDAGTIRVSLAGGAAAGFRFRAKDGGTSGGAEPAWNTTTSGETTDGSITWICDGPDAAAAAPITVPSITDSVTPTLASVRATFAPNPAPTKIGVRLKFGTTSTSTITLAPIDVSFRDGLDDTDPRKACWGAQLTVGKFAHKFFNVEDSTSATISYEDYVFWTDPFDPNTILADYFHRLNEIPGPITAMCVAERRLVVFKQYGIWIFSPTEDANNPIQLERFIGAYGCKGPRCIYVYAGRVYFVGNPDEVYEFDVIGEPVTLAGDAMWSRLFDSSGSFDQSPQYVTYYALAVNESSRDLYVTTKTGESGVYDLDGGGWAVATAGGQPFAAVAYNPQLESLYLWAGSSDAGDGLDALYLNSATAAATDAGGVGNVEAYIEFRPIWRDRRRFTINEFRFFNMSNGTQTSQTCKLEISLDGGVTWDRSATFTMPSTGGATVAVPTAIKGIPVTSHNLSLRLYHSGKGGGDMLRIAAAEAIVTDAGPDDTVIAQPTISAVDLS